MRHEDGNDDGHPSTTPADATRRAILRVLRMGGTVVVGDDPILRDHDVHVAFTGPVMALERHGARFAARVAARLFSQEIHIEDVEIAVEGVLEPSATVEVAKLEEPRLKTTPEKQDGIRGRAPG